MNLWHIVAALVATGVIGLLIHLARCWWIDRTGRLTRAEKRAIARAQASRPAELAAHDRRVLDTHPDTVGLRVHADEIARRHLT